MYATDTLKHYLILFARKHGINDDGEIESLCRNFENEFQVIDSRVDRLKERLATLEGHEQLGDLVTAQRLNELEQRLAALEKHEAATLVDLAKETHS